MRTLTVRGWGTLATFAVLVAVVIAALIATPVSRSEARAIAPPDATAAALARCRALGMAAESDPACHTAWRELNDHFFGRSRL
jgi:conjugative transfer region protein TrbK